MDLLKGLQSYRGFKLGGGSGPPNFERLLAAKLCIGPRKKLEVQERAPGPLSPYQVLWGSDFTHGQGGQKHLVFTVCLSVCLFVTLLNVRVWRRWSTATILMPLNRGRCVLVHPCSTFSDCRQLATSQNAEVEKTATIELFRYHRATE